MYSNIPGDIWDSLQRQVAAIQVVLIIQEHLIQTKWHDITKMNLMHFLDDLQDVADRSTLTDNVVEVELHGG